MILTFAKFLLVQRCLAAFHFRNIPTKICYSTLTDWFITLLSGVSLEASYRRYTAVFVVKNLPLTAAYCGLIFTQTLVVTAAYFD